MGKGAVVLRGTPDLIGSVIEQLTEHQHDKNLIIVDADVGIQGTSGGQGTSGSQGIQGIQGTQGTQGIQGKQGTQGVQGSHDYLQIDCEPAETSYHILKRIPFGRVRFAVITFEHDNYCDEDKEIKNMSRKYLESFGYVMAVNNISEDRWSDFEDWWIHPGLVKKDIFDRMYCVSDSIKKVDHYMLNKI